MRGWMVALVVLGACNGDDKDEGEGCTEATVTISVTNPDGAGVDEAIVKLDDQECTDDGGGTYTCVAGPGDYVVSVIKSPEYDAYAITVTVETDACELAVPVALVGFVY
jgi:uncharacterized membrane protein